MGKIRFYKWTKDSNMPILLKILIYVTLTVTCIYWIGYMLYYTLEAIRTVLHWATKKDLWWVTLTIILVAFIVVLCLMQFCWGLDPFGKFCNWLIEMCNGIRNKIGGFISVN